VLAGGHGVRLRALTRYLYGEDRPKQYAALVGSRSLLRQTLDRVALKIPPERTLVVTLREHADYLAAEFAVTSSPRLLVQPEDRGTAAAILLAAHRIHAAAPQARVATFPSDHFILEEAGFMDHVARVAAVLSREPRRIVVLGAQPTAPESDYGWIEPGAPLGETGACSLHRVRRFWEKPSVETARACLEAGFLWNTFVLVSKASALVHAGQQFLPYLHEQFARLPPLFATKREDRAIHEAYMAVPSANFSYSVLARCPHSLLVSKLPRLTWCDLGTPDRVLRTLRAVGMSPPWAAAAETWHRLDDAG
jgi:mannose-1-phosphate guanylyltransferase